MLVIFILTVIAKVCQFEENLKYVDKVLSVEKEVERGFIYSSTRYYINCILKNEKEKKFGICTNCYNRIVFDSKFFDIVKHCNLVYLDKSHVIFTNKDVRTTKNCILILESKEKYYLPVYSNEAFYAVDLISFNLANTKLFLKFTAKMDLIPYNQLSGITDYCFYKAEDCMLSMSLDDYLEREYTKDVMLQYSKSFSNLYFGKLPKTAADSSNSSDFTRSMSITVNNTRDVINEISTLINADEQANT